jgi:hypothetical protein
MQRYIIEKYTEGLIEKYKVVAQSTTGSLSLLGEQLICYGDDDLLYPEVIFVEVYTDQNDPSLQPYVIENNAKIIAIDLLSTELKALKLSIISFDFNNADPSEALAYLRKIGRVRQIELKIEAGDF